MSFDRIQYVRVLKRLEEASGYLELGMVPEALARLSGLGDLGPLKPHVQLLQRCAVSLQERLGRADNPLARTRRQSRAPDSAPDGDQPAGPPSSN